MSSAEPRPRLVEPDELEAVEAPSPLKARPRSDHPTVSYRVDGNLMFRAEDLEQKVFLAEERIRAVEQELWAARKELRKHLATRSVSIGGLAALVGMLLGGVAAYFEGDQRLMPVFGFFGFVVGYLASGRWRPPDDNFPSAPPIDVTRLGM